MSDLSMENSREKKFKEIDWEKLLLTYRFQILFVLIGLSLIGFGALLFKKSGVNSFEKIEVLDGERGALDGEKRVVVEVAGAVENPGVYKLENDSRIEDVLIAAGGISADADRDWMQKVVNRAAKVIDGQKIYIPRTGEQSGVLSAKNEGGYQSASSNISVPGEGLVDINSASPKGLESLSGIGPVYAQNIIEHRPYSTIEELVSKGAIKQYVFEKIKDKVSVY